MNSLLRIVLILSFFHSDAQAAAQARLYNPAQSANVAGPYAPWKGLKTVDTHTDINRYRANSDVTGAASAQAASRPTQSASTPTQSIKIAQSPVKKNSPDFSFRSFKLTPEDRQPAAMMAAHSEDDADKKAAVDDTLTERLITNFDPILSLETTQEDDSFTTQLICHHKPTAADDATPNRIWLGTIEYYQDGLETIISETLLADKNNNEYRQLLKKYAQIPLNMKIMFNKDIQSLLLNASVRQSPTKQQQRQKMKAEEDQDEIAAQMAELSLRAQSDRSASSSQATSSTGSSPLSTTQSSVQASPPPPEDDDNKLQFEMDN